MSICIDDKLIKRLVKEYQETGKNFREIAEHLSQYIYNYPAIVWRLDKDICSEFFIYIFERLEKLLLKYQLFDCQFKTWLVVVLRMNFINWRKKVSSSVNYKLIVDYMLLSQEIFTKKIEKDNLSLEKIYKIKNAINELPKKIKIVLQLHFFDVFEKQDFSEISSIFHIKINLLIHNFDKLLSDFSKKSIKNQEYLNKLTKVFQKYMEYKDKVFKSKINKKKLKLLQSKTTQLENRLNILRKDYNKFYLKIDAQIIANFLGLSTNAVYNLIYRGKILLKQKLVDLL